MSNNHNSSSYIIDTDQNRLGMNSLFHRANDQREKASKPYSERNMPASFYQQPQANKRSKSDDGQYLKSPLSLPSTSSHSRTDNNNAHSRGVSDSAILTGQSAVNTRLSHINAPAAGLPLPDGWTENRTLDGQIYYIDHLTKSTTWVDPRTSHYAAFRLYCTTLALPDGCIQKYDPTGNIYFVDHKDKQTYWDDPRPNYYRSSMTKRLDLPSAMTSQPQENLLTNRLTTIIKQRHALQLRTQELEQMEADIRKKLHEHGGANNQSLTAQPEIELLIDDLFLHRRHDSADSGLGDGSSSMNQTLDTFSDFSDNLPLSNSSEFSSFPFNIGLPVHNSHPISMMNHSPSKTMSNKQPPQHRFETYF